MPESLFDLENPTGGSRSGPLLTLAATAGLSFLPAYCLYASSAMTTSPDLENHSLAVSTTGGEDVEFSSQQDLELESPNFAPPELDDFRRRGFERSNRWT